MKIRFLLPALLIVSLAYGQDNVRYIEVTGSAEMEVEPDEIRLVVAIQEYWEEEFEKKNPDKFQTKVPIAVIEAELLGQLESLEIEEEDIFVRQVGNYWRATGKEFLFSKEVEIVLNDMDKVNQLVASINARGIRSMRISELKNSEITKFRREVKIRALTAAREKAEYLLASVDRKPGDILMIQEYESAPWTILPPNSYLSNVNLGEGQSSVSIDNVGKIKLRYEIKARFEISPLRLEEK